MKVFQPTEVRHHYAHGGAQCADVVAHFIDGALEAWNTAKPLAKKDFRFAIDLETTGLSPTGHDYDSDKKERRAHDGEITIVGMSYDGDFVMLANPSVVDKRQLLTLLRSGMPKVFHNAKFDIKWLMEKFGLEFDDFEACDDTYVMHRLLNTGFQKSSSLQAAAFDILDGLALDKETRTEFIGNRVMTPKMLQYAAMDVAVTWAIHKPLLERIHDEEMELCYLEIERPCIPVVAEMESIGVHCDLRYIDQLREMLEGKIVRYQAELDWRVLQFNAMPTYRRKLLVKDKLERGIPKTDEAYEDLPQPCLNVGSAQQVLHAMNLIGLTVKKTDKAALEAPAYSVDSLRAAWRRLETTAKAGPIERPIAATKQMTDKERLALETRELRARIAAMEAGDDVTMPKAPDSPPTADKEPDYAVLWRTGLLPDDVLPIAMDLAERVLDLRAARMAIQTFVTPLLDHHINPKTGKVHTSFNQVDTVTGRFSDKEPNFQQMPSARKDSVFEGMTFRRAFHPRKGFKMLVFDYQACEVRILAEMSRDKGLIAACEGDDPHMGNAAIMFEEENGSVDIKLVTKDQRTKSKTGIFTVVYGGGPRRVAALLKSSIEAAKSVMGQIFGKFPGIPRFISAMQAMAIDKGYVISLSGRRRHFDLPKKPVYDPKESAFAYQTALKVYQGMVARVERQAQNAPIQASNADITKLAMVLVRRALKPYGGFLLLTVHDELVAEVPEEHVEAAFKAMGDAMLAAEAEFFQHVKPAIEGKYGDWWVK